MATTIKHNGDTVTLTGRIGCNDEACTNDACAEFRLDGQTYYQEASVLLATEIGRIAAHHPKAKILRSAMSSLDPLTGLVLAEQIIAIAGDESTKPLAAIVAKWVNKALDLYPPAACLN